jgi:hypothetical protein
VREDDIEDLEEEREMREARLRRLERELDEFPALGEPAALA